MSLDDRTVDRSAVIRVRDASRGTVLGICSLTYHVRDAGVTNVVLQRSKATQRILPIPQAVYDSSDMGAPQPQR